jgi:hypothetical protein
MLILPRKIKMLLSKRQSLTLVKAAVLIFAFSIYLIVLVRESMNAMNNNAKPKTVSKVDIVSLFFITALFCYLLC